jgi:hypothetical protein
MGRACSAHAVVEQCSTDCWWGYLKERGYLGDRRSWCLQETGEIVVK